MSNGSTRHRALLLLGPTASGKTPLGKLIEERGLWDFRWVHFDFGAQMRKRGKEIKVYFSHGTNDMTQSVKGSRDEVRYVAIDVFLPDGRRVKNVRTFYEGDRGVVDNIKHGNAAAKAKGVATGLCGEARNNLITIVTPEALDAQ